MIPFNSAIPKTGVGKTLAVVAVSVGIYALGAVAVGWEGLRVELADFPRRMFIPLIILSFANYGLRYWRWEVLIRNLGARVPVRESSGLYFATYLMVITPGKIGELFKASILRDRYGLELTRGVPAVFVERINDFLAIFILAIAGIFFWPETLAGVGTGIAAATMLPLILILLHNRAVRHRLVTQCIKAPLLAKFQINFDAAAEAFGALISGKIMLFTVPVSAIAWLSECLGLWLVCHSLQIGVSVGEALFVYAVGTLVGSLSFLPGGIGGTEATMIWLLHTLSVPMPIAASVALIVRLSTLWLAVVVGFVFFLAHRRLMLSPAAADNSAGSGSAKL